MKYSALTISILILVASCSNDKKKDPICVSLINKNENVYVIDFDKTDKEASINMSDYFKSAGIIILEVNDESIIGGINTLRVVDNYIIIKDETANQVLVFDKKGQFLHHIGSVGQGPGEYISLSDISVDFDKKEIYLYDFTNDKINKYNIESGNFISSVIFTDKSMFNNYIQYIDNKIYTNACPASDNESESFLLQEIDLQSGNPKASYLKASEFNYGWNRLYHREEGFFYPTTKGEAKYIEMFMNTIVSIDKDGIRPYLMFKIDSWITEKDVQRLLNAESNDDISLKHSILYEGNLAYNINRYFESEDLIHFQFWNNKERDHNVVLFNKKTKTARICGIFKDDLLYKGESFLFHQFVFADNQYIYSYIEPRNIPYLLNITSLEGLNIDTDKQKQLMELSEESNPIIVYYE